QCLRCSAPGWFLVRSSTPQLFSLIRKNTEAAPNSYTGSGPGVFPHQDGFAPHFPFQGNVGRRAPETSPCHVQAKQIGELDPRRVTHPPPRSSAASRATQGGGDGDRYASAQFKTGSARGQPRQAPPVRKSS